MALLRFVFRNWALKLSAVALAIVLFIGMVALQNAQAWSGEVPIVAVNQPSTAVMISALPNVSRIRFIASPDVRITQASFRATIDLASVTVSDSENSLVRVQLVATDPRIQIIDFEPQQIGVTLDPIIRKTISVRVEEPAGSTPTGLTLGTETLSVQQVEVEGAQSAVAKVAYAQALVRIDASGLDFNDNVDLKAVDATGAAVTGQLQLNPRSVNVQIQIGSQLRTQTVPVSPVITGAPAAGYYISGINVTPSVVGVRGQADALAQLHGLAATKAVSIAGATGDVSVQVGLDLPSGVQAPASPLFRSWSICSHPAPRALSRWAWRPMGRAPIASTPSRRQASASPLEARLRHSMRSILRLSSPSSRSAISTSASTPFRSPLRFRQASRRCRSTRRRSRSRSPRPRHRLRL